MRCVPWLNETIIADARLANQLLGGSQYRQFAQLFVRRPFCMRQGFDSPPESGFT
ncbi:hypothetical protein [Bowmanella dokdonensis]|uniref:Uncharacterized protein n=1 Tax=Bowmanella dokdonensis TaxID=751969 RepID=A0A939DNN8_9ALTE|nr:hypothetical protein [Bowmanella dokdonensis]MBN7825126.1 hypothetical protein [Bowmanella dokdonensis]